MSRRKSATRLAEGMVVLQQATATLAEEQARFFQKQAVFDARMDRFSKSIDWRCAAIIQRCDRIEALMQRMFAELPERIFRFAQMAQSESG